MKRENHSRHAATGAGWRRFRVPAGLLLAGGLAACAPNAYLEPAPSATTPPHSENAAVGKAEGVRVVANGHDWRGYPSDLGSAYTPVKVYIHNGSDQPIEIRYKDFELATTGFNSTALPLYKISGSVDGGYVDGGAYGIAPIVPAFTYQGFYLAPYYAPFYDWGFDEWDGPFAWDYGYYSNYYPMWGASLPTTDMRAQAIPEGVLKPDGSLSGFVYFQKIDKNAGSVTLTFDLVNADNRKTIGKVELPFVAR